jgi:Regulator of ribonuclease activity B/FHA domain
MSKPDAKILAKLQKAGSDLTRPHPVEFFLYFPSEASARSAAGQIQAGGFEVRVEQAGSGPAWLCKADKLMVPSLRVMTDLRGKFTKLADQLGGEYDGWGSQVVRGNGEPAATATTAVAAPADASAVTAQGKLAPAAAATAPPPHAPAHAAPQGAQRPPGIYPILVQVLAGPTKGMRHAFDFTPISFGREAGNAVIVGDPHVSRHHGELRFESGSWSLINLSPNGTTVGRRKVKNKPAYLHEGETVSVGGQDVFAVHLEPAAATTLPVSDDADEQAAAVLAPEAAVAMSKRKKLFIGIGVYLAAMVGLFIFFSTLAPRAMISQQLPPRWTPQQIADTLAAPMKVEQANPRLVQSELEQANELYPSAENSDRRLFQCYMHYRRALANSDRKQFENGLDNIRFQQVRQKLTQKIAELYDQGYRYLESSQWGAAARAFEGIKDFYDDSESPLNNHLEAVQNVAVKRAPRNWQKGK